MIERFGWLESLVVDVLFTVDNLTRGTSLGTRIAVAGSSELRRRGLLQTEALATGAGLWIAPCEAVHTLGMRWPIDVLFLSKDYAVRKIVGNLVPWRIAVCLRAYSVLELQTGAVEASGTRPGDQLRFREAEV